MVHREVEAWLPQTVPWKKRRHCRYYLHSLPELDMNCPLRIGRSHWYQRRNPGIESEHWNLEGEWKCGKCVVNVAFLKCIFKRFVLLHSCGLVRTTNQGAWEQAVCRFDRLIQEVDVVVVGTALCWSHTSWVAGKSSTVFGICLESAHCSGLDALVGMLDKVIVAEYPATAHFDLSFFSP